MSRTSKLFDDVPVDIPNRSGYDMSHENIGSMTTGTLIPFLCELISPNETFSLGHVTQVNLPPLATNFFGRVDLRLEAFFVPLRILWQGWQNFWTMPFNNPYGATVVRPTSTPDLKVDTTVQNFQNGSLIGPGTLSDYLGYKVNSPTQSVPSYVIPNILPYLAYHRIWNDWYRNKLVMRPCFANNEDGTASVVSRAPWVAHKFSIAPDDSGTLLPYLLADGVNIMSLRQRCYAKDYFTTAALYPQGSGDVAGSTVEIPDGQNEISIGAIRAANVLQRWMDRNNIAGEEYADQIRAHFGVLPSDAIIQRPIFLGGDSVGIYNRSIYQTGSGNSQTGNKNSFAVLLGGEGGNAKGFKDGTLSSKFRATEHGYLMVLASVVPHAYYSSGINRQLWYHERGDFPVPLLQGLGEQPIFTEELGLPGNGVMFDRTNIFGYTKQYSEIKYHNDEVHGELSDIRNLFSKSYALQRSFDNTVTLGSDFLEIGTDDLDDVLMAASSVNFRAWYDCYISFKKVSPFSEYVIPTLGDLKDTHKERIPFRGRQIN